MQLSEGTDHKQFVECESEYLEIGGPISMRDGTMVSNPNLNKSQFKFGKSSYAPVKQSEGMFSLEGSRMVKGSGEEAINFDYGVSPMQLTSRG